MDELVEYLTRTIPAVFESEEYEERKKQVVEAFKSKQDALVKEFEREAAERGFTIMQLQVGMVSKPGIVPVIDGKPVTFEQLNMRNLERALREKVTELDHQMIKPLVEHRIDECVSKYRNHRLRTYLEAVKQHILENLAPFRERGEKEKPFGPLKLDPFLEYRINLLVDNHGAKRAPVVFETSPGYRNLFGTIERVVDATGHWRTDFTRIKAGSFLQADGGYLILEAMDTLIEPGVWPALKRGLRNRSIEIQSYDPFYLLGGSALKPEPIECDVKVIMVGDTFLYHLLYERDEDFKKIFKIRADFDWVMEVDRKAILRYANFMKRIVSQEKLKPFRKDGVARVVEFGMRLAGTKKKLSTQFNAIADVLREANHWASKDGAKKVKAEHVEKALEEKVDRCKLVFGLGYR